MKTYFVTGGAGFIGANFIKYLLEKYDTGVEIIILDDLTYAGNLLSIKGDIERGNVTFIKGNICDRFLVTRLLTEHDPDYIINFAAESHVDRSISDPRLFIETNVSGTQNLLECTRLFWKSGNSAWPDGKKFLQISTDEVYGSLPREYNVPQPIARCSDPLEAALGHKRPLTFGSGSFSEISPMSPRSPYSASKAGADMMALAYHETYGMPVNITRCSNNYGPYQFPEKLIPLIIKNILDGRDLPIYGNGENVRDWIHVRDHAKAIDIVLRKGIPGEIYNIGSVNEQQNIDIINMIIDLVAETTGTRPRHDLKTYVSDRPGHDIRYAIDPIKIIERLGWVPETDFSEGMKQTVRWYIENRPWVDSVTTGEYQKYYDEMYLNR